MPFFFSERLPLPSLKSYCMLSISIFLLSLIYGSNQLTDSHWYSLELQNLTALYEVYISEPFCLWSLINIAFCCLFLFGKVIQKVVLGELRISEEQNLQDKFWNYIFYKNIFVFGVVNAQSINEVLCWTAWFSMLGFWHMFGQLCKDRFKYLTSSPFTAHSKHVRLMLLIATIFVSSIALSICAVKFGYTEGWNILMFMLTECALLGLKAVHLLARYTFHMLELSQPGLWTTKAKFTYYVDLSIECVILAVDLVFHLHMLIWSNVFLSMASLVLYWNIRSIFTLFKKRIKKHRLYKKILRSVATRFELATREDIEKFADHCAICWESMSDARKLPCAHLFHHSCLCSWLQQDVSCPTCRRPLTNDMGLPTIVTNVDDESEINADDLQNIAGNQTDNNSGFHNYFFFLDGRQIANWFPSFSIEVFHGRMEQGELNQQAEQLFRMFPDVTREVILEDLRHTGSADATADNILEGNISVPESTQPPMEQAPAIEPTVNNETSDGCCTKTDEECEESEESAANEEESSQASSEIDVNIHSESLRNRVKRRYLNKNGGNCSTVTHPTQPQEGEKEERRNLLLQAVERRQNASHT